jgi:hypothetical protein
MSTKKEEQKAYLKHLQDLLQDFSLSSLDISLQGIHLSLLDKHHKPKTPHNNQLFQLLLSTIRL